MRVHLEIAASFLLLQQFDALDEPLSITTWKALSADTWKGLVSCRGVGRTAWTDCAYRIRHERCGLVCDEQERPDYSLAANGFSRLQEAHVPW